MVGSWGSRSFLCADNEHDDCDGCAPDIETFAPGTGSEQPPHDLRNDVHEYSKMEFHDTVPEVAALRGDNHKDDKTYHRAVTNMALTLDEDGLRKLGTRLYRNLLGVGNRISVLVEQLDPKTLMVRRGVRHLYGASRHFSARPHAHGVFFESSHFRGHGDDPMSAFLTASASQSTNSATWS